MTDNWIYLLHCKEHKDINVYKLGKTKRPFKKRISEYGDPDVILILRVNDADAAEPIILHEMKKSYDIYKGLEYFRVPDVTKFTDDIMKVVTENRLNQHNYPLPPDCKSKAETYRKKWEGRHRYAKEAKQITSNLPEEQIGSPDLLVITSDLIYEHKQLMEMTKKLLL